jgi:hypothetical protein
VLCDGSSARISTEKISRAAHAGARMSRAMRVADERKNHPRILRAAMCGEGKLRWHAADASPRTAPAPRQSVQGKANPMLRNAKELEHYELRARDGKIGHLVDLFFDDREWIVRYLVADTGTWLDRRKVLISPVAVSRAEWDQRLLPLNLTQEQIRNSPSVDTERPVSREHELALTHYYDWPAYWGAAGFPDVGFALPLVPPYIPDTQPAREAAAPAPPAAVHEDPHLRSVRAVRGHTIEAKDGNVGHVEDFLIDDRSWEVRYLIVDTRNWWPGRMVIVAPQWIHDVGWEEAKVRVDLTRNAIRTSPAYDPSKPITPDYAGQLHDHYEKERRPIG